MLRGHMRAEQRGLGLLALGAVAGLLLATARLVWHPAASASPPAEVVAVVNGVPIPRLDFEHAVAAVAADRRDGLREGDEARVLARLIDEELLLQRGLALGLVRREPRVRGQLIGTMIDTVLAEAGARDPTESELRAFYDQHRDYFARAGGLRVIHRAVAGTDGSARERAVALVDALRAGRVPEARTEVVTAPDALLPVAKLEQYLGPSVLETALALPVGGVSQPIASTGGYHVVQVMEREPELVPPFDAVQALVREELVRRRGEEALRAYLDQLRSEADVSTGTGVE